MRVTLKRFHNQARLHVGSGLFLVVYAELEFSDNGEGPTSLRSQHLDWQGVLTYERPLSPDNAFALSTLYEDPRLELCHTPARAGGYRRVCLTPVPCEIGDVTLTHERVKLHVKGPLTEQPLSELLTYHLNRLVS